MILNLTENIDPECYDRLHKILECLEYQRYCEDRGDKMEWELADACFDENMNWFHENHPELTNSVDRICVEYLIGSTL
jgi:hypothetical protein